MAIKVILVLDDDVKEGPDDLIPAGERSRFANEALRAQLTLARRRHAIAETEALRQAGPHIPTAEVLLALRGTRVAKWERHVHE